MSSQERREKERENRRSAILKAARKLFFDRGFKSVTVNNIADKAEVSKGSVYLYFKSKEDIYTQILINQFPRVEGVAVPTSLRNSASPGISHVFNAATDLRHPHYMRSKTRIIPIICVISVSQDG